MAINSRCHTPININNAGRRRCCAEAVCTHNSVLSSIRKPQFHSWGLLSVIVVLSIVAHGVSLTSSSWLMPNNELRVSSEPKLRYLGRARLTPTQLESLNARNGNNLVFVNAAQDLSAGNNNNGNDVSINDNIEQDDQEQDDDIDDINNQQYQTSNDQPLELTQAQTAQALASARERLATQWNQLMADINKRKWQEATYSVPGRPVATAVPIIAPVNLPEPIVNDKQDDDDRLSNDDQHSIDANGSNDGDDSNAINDNNDKNDNEIGNDHSDRTIANDEEDNNVDMMNMKDSKSSSNNKDDVADDDDDNDIDRNNTTNVNADLSSANRTNFDKTNDTNSSIVDHKIDVNRTSTAIPAAVGVAAQQMTSSTVRPSSVSHDHDDHHAVLPSEINKREVWWQHPISFLGNLFITTNAVTSENMKQHQQQQQQQPTPDTENKTQASSWLDSIRSYFRSSSSNKDNNTSNVDVDKRKSEGGQKELEEEDSLGKQEREAELSLASTLASSNKLHQSLSSPVSGEIESSRLPSKSVVNQRLQQLNRDDIGLSNNRIDTNQNLSDNDDEGDDDEGTDDDENSARRQMLTSSSAWRMHQALADREPPASMLRRSDINSLLGDHNDAPVLPSPSLMGVAGNSHQRSFGGPLPGMDESFMGYKQSQRQPQQQQIVHATNDLYFVVLVAGFSCMTMAIVLLAGWFTYRVQQTRKSVQDVDYPTYGVVGPNSLNSKTSSHHDGGNPFNGPMDQCGGAATGGTGKSTGSTRSLADLMSPSSASGSLKGGPTIGGSSDQLSSSGTVNILANAMNQRQSPVDKQQQQQQQKSTVNQNAARMYHYHHQKKQMLTSDKGPIAGAGHTSDCDSEDDENDEGAYTVYECPGLASTHEMEVKNPLFLDDPTPVSSPAIK